jgi:selenoprotein W-related protein
METISTGAIQRLNDWVERFAAEEAQAHAGALAGMRLKVKNAHSAFVEGEWAEIATKLGPVLWLPPRRAYNVFLHAYSALFCIPAFTLEALQRDPVRFTAERLPHTVRTTSGFILDAFGYDRRVEKRRDVLYWPSPAIRMAHTERGASKPRISNAAMAYFAYHLVCAAEYLAGGDKLDGQIRQEHYDYFGEFLRRAGYPFAARREDMAAFAAEVDRLLAGADTADLVGNAVDAAQALEVDLVPEELIKFLPPYSALRAKEALAAHQGQPLTPEPLRHFEIEYCVRCGYRPRAMEVAESLLERLGQEAARVVLVPSDGGRFEVRIDDELIFSGLRLGRLPEVAEIEAGL